MDDACNSVIFIPVVYIRLLLELTSTDAIFGSEVARHGIHMTPSPIVVCELPILLRTRVCIRSSCEAIDFQILMARRA